MSKEILSANQIDYSSVSSHPRFLITSPSVPIPEFDVISSCSLSLDLPTRGGRFLSQLTGAEASTLLESDFKSHLPQVPLSSTDTKP
ncbi:MAG: hypothetical protein GY696_33710 [Gammaproteobacteria bacterium]|nr:hypothetical protein [Gammaproteobacteria bacterium]